MIIMTIMQSAKFRAMMSDYSKSETFPYRWKREEETQCQETKGELEKRPICEDGDAAGRRGATEVSAALSAALSG